MSGCRRTLTFEQAEDVHVFFPFAPLEAAQRDVFPVDRDQRFRLHAVSGRTECKRICPLIENGGFAVGFFQQFLPIARENPEFVPAFTLVHPLLIHGFVERFAHAEFPAP